MRCHVIHGRELSDTLAARWSALQTSNPVLSSPYFCPEFTRAVATVREDVRIAIYEEAGRPAAFLPFQLRRLGGAGPVGGQLSDYQGLIVERNEGWDAAEMVRGAGLSYWDFDHLLCAQTPFRAHSTAISESSVMDLSRGYEAYVGDRRAAGSKLFLRLGALRRKLEREVGPIRFETESSDSAVLDRLIGWKSAQCRRTGSIDVFAVKWTRALLHGLLRTRTETFGGVLSALWVGDELLAAHFGMRSRTQLHYWFPTYSHAFAAYSPGLLLLDDIAREAAASGLGSIDLGKGQADYKDRTRSHCIPIAEGSVELPSLVVRARRARVRTEAWVRKSPIAGPARIPGRALRRLEKWMRLR